MLLLLLLIFYEHCSPLGRFMSPTAPGQLTPWPPPSPSTSFWVLLLKSCLNSIKLFARQMASRFCCCSLRCRCCCCCSVVVVAKFVTLPLRVGRLAESSPVLMRQPHAEPSRIESSLFFCVNIEEIACGTFNWLPHQQKQQRQQQRTLQSTWRGVGGGEADRAVEKGVTHKNGKQLSYLDYGLGQGKQQIEAIL